MTRIPTSCAAAEMLSRDVTSSPGRWLPVCVAAGPALAAAQAVVETDVTIKTPDGMCDAAFIHPATGSHPGVLIWPDAFGLRPAMRDIGKRIAAEGYSVLVPNPFYRVAKAPQFDDASSFNFQNQADMAKLKPLMGSINAPGAAEKDAVAYVAFLDAQSQVNATKKIGTQGYCMGGPLVVKTAAAVPNRIGAGASFHGGGLVTDKPDSPHLLAPRDQGADVLRDRSRATTSANPTRKTSSRRRLRGRRSCGNRSLSGHARLVCSGYAGRERCADLQRARSRTRLAQARRSLQSESCLGWRASQGMPQREGATSIGRMTRHGFPAAKTSSGMLRVTTLPAPITDGGPMRTPGQMIAPPPTLSVMAITKNWFIVRPVMN